MRSAPRLEESNTSTFDPSGEITGTPLTEFDGGRSVGFSSHKPGPEAPAADPQSSKETCVPFKREIPQLGIVEPRKISFFCVGGSAELYPASPRFFCQQNPAVSRYIVKPQHAGQAKNNSLFSIEARA